MHLHLLLLSTALICGTASAQIPTPEGVSLKDSHLSGRMRAQIERDLGVDGSEEQDRELALTLSEVKLVRLGPALPSVIRIDGGGPLLGDNHPVLFYDQRSGRKILQTEGWGVDTVRPIHHGAHDVASSWKRGAGDGVLTYYRFDGKVYRRAKETHYTF